jgi:hypothetical protein
MVDARAACVESHKEEMMSKGKSMKKEAKKPKKKK